MDLRGIAIADGNPSPSLPQIRETALARLEKWGAVLESGLNAAPIRDLVGVQLCAGLATATYLRDNKVAKFRKRHFAKLKQ